MDPQPQLEHDPGVPPPIVEQDIVFSVDFHPAQPVIACGLITGAVCVYKFGVQAEENSRVVKFKFHKESCRSLRFTPDATSLYTASADRSVRQVDCNTATVTWNQTRCHDAPINCLRCLSNDIFATGDDNGVVKIWDRRSNRVTHWYTEHQDFISDMCVSPDGNFVIVTGGDGHLGVFDLRKKHLEALSDNMEDELLSVTLMKNGTKAVCGAQSGALDIFTFGDWGDFRDRMPTHGSVDTIAKLTESVLFTGSTDGLIRAYHIHPNKALGVVGSHNDLPVEEIRVSPDGRFLVSCSHDHTIRFWNADIVGGKARPKPEPEAIDKSSEESSDNDSDSDDDMMDDDGDNANENVNGNANKSNDGLTPYDSDGDDDSDAGPDLSSSEEEAPSANNVINRAKRNLKGKRNFFKDL